MVHFDFLPDIKHTENEHILTTDAGDED